MDPCAQLFTGNRNRHKRQPKESSMEMGFKQDVHNAHLDWNNNYNRSEGLAGERTGCILRFRCMCFGANSYFTAMQKTKTRQKSGFGGWGAIGESEEFATNSFTIQVGM